MSFSYLDNAELEEALELYMENIAASGMQLGEEEILVKDSLGRIVSQAVISKISAPHYNSCAMDGIALSAKSTFGATDTTPVILRESIDFERVDTGNPLPDRFDSVVMIEDVIEAGENSVRIISAAVPWQHVRQIGEDICAGEMIIPSNTKIEPGTLGAMLAAGVSKVTVYKKPVIGIIPTGGEIVEPLESPGKGEIIEFNSAIFSGMLINWGAEPVIYSIVPDNKDLIKNAIEKAVKECDIVLLNAGSSAGRKDFSAEILSETGKVIIHGVSIRPGKPVIMSVVNKHPVIGIPGYPFSGIIIMENVVKPLLEYFQKTTFDSNQEIEAIISRKIVSSLKYKEFVRIKLGYVNNRFVAVPLNRGAGIVTSFVRADGILEIPTNVEGYEAGHVAKVRLLRPREEIENTFVVTGSHDPIIEVISDLMRKTHKNEYLASANVGSMGGITAIKRMEAHAAGIHLLDEETGQYNISYVRKYLNINEVSILKCTKRLQGIMVAPQNPKEIRNLTDIIEKGLKYVNRQKGAGTRILLDYLLKKQGLHSFDINGYENEEYTHMSVAALISAGSADAGMGVYSAAKAYGLGFIPLCEEEYDFVIPKRFLESEMTQHFISIIKSQSFADALSSMGGYKLERAGDVV